MTTDTKTTVKALFWSGTDGEAEYENAAADLELERDEDNPSMIALHTFVDGRGSVTSYYIDREQAIRLAHALLSEAMIR